MGKLVKKTGTVTFAGKGRLKSLDGSNPIDFSGAAPAVRQRAGSVTFHAPRQSDVQSPERPQAAAPVSSRNQWASTGGGRKSTTDAGKLQQETMQKFGGSSWAFDYEADPAKVRAAEEKGDRLNRTLTGAGKSWASGFVNAGGMLEEGAGYANTGIANYQAADTLRTARENIERYEGMLESGKKLDGTLLTDADRRQLRTFIESNQRKIDAHRGYTDFVEKSDKAAADKAYRKADELADSAARDIAQAKDGMGAVGQFAVDAGVAGAQMAADMAAAALTGGSALIPMFVRGAGSSAQEARQAGAAYGQQLAYGLSSGALSVATEKIGNVAAPFRKAFGAGVLDKAIAGAVSRMNGSAAGKLALSMLSEGGEEFIEDVFQPILQRATYDPDARFDLSGALYDAAVGAVLGGLGSGVEVMQSEHERMRLKTAEELAAERRKAAGQTAAVTIESGPSAINERSKANNTLAYTLATNIDAIRDMEPVSRLSGTELNNRSVKPDQQIRTFFHSLGNKVFRKNLGEVQLNEYGIASMLNHKPLNRAKMLSLAAVPDVIASGRQISRVPDWKGRGYTSYIFAAPVTVGDGTVYVAAVVDQRPDNKFYLSEMVDSEGNYVRVNENPSGNSKSGVIGGVGMPDGAEITARPERFSEESVPSVPQTGTEPTLPVDTGESANPTSLAANGDAGARSQASVEGTRPLNTDFTIAQGAEDVNSAEALRLKTAEELAAERAGRKNAASGVEAANRAYRGAVPQNVNDSHIGRLELTSEKYNPAGADIRTLYGNRYRSQVKADAIERLGIQDNRPAYLMASNITKDGKTYYLDVTKASLNKMLYTEKGSPLQIERLLLIDNLEKAIDSSYWVESSGDRKGRQQVNGFDTLRTSFYVDGDPYYADIKVKVVQQGKDADAQNVVYFLEPAGVPVIKRADNGSPTVERHARNIVFGDPLSAGVEGTRPLNVDSTIAQGAENVNSAEALRLKTAEELAAERTGRKNAASGVETAGGSTHMTMEDFTDTDSPVWRNLPYADADAQTSIQRETHDAMVKDGSIVQIPEETKNRVSQSFPDLQGMKKAERTPILKQKMSSLKTELRKFLSGLKGANYEFDVNGNILDAKLYNTGIREVMEKVTKDKASMLYHSDEIFKNARYLYSTPDYDGDPNIYRWNYFYTPVQIGDTVTGVRIAVRDVVKGTNLTPESQIYNWGIKKAPVDGESRDPKAASLDVSLGASSEGTRPLNADNSIAQGAENVKNGGSGAEAQVLQGENSNATMGTAEKSVKEADSSDRGGEESARRKAFEGSETLWGALRWESGTEPGYRSTGERRSRFHERMSQAGAETRESGGVEYGYRPVSLNEAGDYARAAVQELEKLGVKDCFIFDGEVQVNRAGITTGSSSDGLTLRDGSVGINNNAAGDAAEARNTAAHEAVHQKLRTGNNKAEVYQRILMDNIDVSSPAFQIYYDAINQGYFNGNLDTGSKAQVSKFINELSAYIGGHIYSGVMDNAAMFHDYRAVRSALEGTLGVRLDGEAKSSRPRNALERVGIDPYGSEADYTNADWDASQAAGRKKLRGQLEKEIRRTPHTEKEMRLARQLADGQLDSVDIPATVNRETVETLADYLYAMKGSDNTGELRRRRNDILNREMEKMEPLLGIDVDYDETGLETLSALPEGLRNAVKGVGRKFSTLERNFRTPGRICTHEWGAEHGRKVYETLFAPVVENNGRQVDWVNGMLDRVRTFKDSSGKERKLTRQERALTQKLVEYSASEKRVAAFDRQYQSAVENVRKGWAPEDAARMFGIQKDMQEYQDLQNYRVYLDTLEALSKKDGGADKAIVEAAAKKYGTVYRELYSAINTFLVAHGYEPIGFIEGYAPHLQPKDDKVKLTNALKALGLDEKAMELPTSISGRTAELKPYKQYNPFFQERHGDKVDYDIVRGYEDYIYYLGNIFFHTDDIMRLRTAEKYLRKTYTTEEASEQISWAENARNFSEKQKEDFLRMNHVIKDGTVLAEGDASVQLEKYIDGLYDKIGSVTRYGELAKYLDNYANRLAGKQNAFDRSTENMAGRPALNLVNKVNGLFGPAKIAFNAASALNQTAQLPFVQAECGIRNTVQAEADFFRQGKAARDDFISKSSFLKGKRGVEWISEPETFFEKTRETGYAMSEAVDAFTSYVAVRGKYLQEVKGGRSPAEAMRLADDFGRRVMGSRARGEKPLAFDSKNPLLQVATRFQLEVMNQLEYAAKDIPAEIRQIARTQGKAAAAKRAAGMGLSYTLGAFLLNTVVSGISGGTPAAYDLAGNLLEAWGASCGLSRNRALLTILDNVLDALIDRRLFGTEPPDDEDRDGEAFAKSLAGNIANDIPLVSNVATMLGYGDGTLPVSDFSKIGKVGDAVKKAARGEADFGDVVDAGLTAAGEFLPGGNQLRKSFQGIRGALEGGVYSGDRLKYPVGRNAWNLAKGSLFGRAGFGDTEQYYASGDPALTERMTGVWRDMVDEGIDGRYAYDLIQRIRKGQTTAEKLETITGTLLPDSQKLALFSGIAANEGSRRPEEFRELMKNGMGWGDVAQAYQKYLELNGRDDLNASRKATEFARWLDRESGLSAAGQAAIKETMVFYSQAPAAGNYDEIMEMEQAGIDEGVYTAFKEQIAGLTSDRDSAGNPIAGSKKKKILNVIDGMDLTDAQKDALYLAEGYQESTLDDAPWNTEVRKYSLKVPTVPKLNTPKLNTPSLEDLRLPAP